MYSMDQKGWGNGIKLPSIYELFFEVQKLSNPHFLEDECMNVHSDVFPHTRPWTNSQGNPWRQHNCFLNISEISQGPLEEGEKNQTNTIITLRTHKVPQQMVKIMIISGKYHLNK